MTEDHASMKLWVDDLRKAPKGWHWAMTITEAIRILATQKVGVVALDHDICNILPNKEGAPADIEPITCPENYTAVAYYIAAMCIDERPNEVWVHTANPAGSGEIHNILKPCVGMIIYRGFHPDWKKENP